MSKTDELLDEERQTTDAQPDTDDASGGDDAENSGNEGAVTFSEAQQAKIDEIIAKRLERQEKQLKAEADAQRQKAEQEAKEARLAEQQKFQELAETRKTKLDELEPQVTTLEQERDRYREALQAHVAEQMESLPDYVVDLLKDRDPIEQMEYLTAHAADFEQGREGPPKSPKRRGNGDVNDDEKRRRAARTW